jgi:hypothetical protein
LVQSVEIQIREQRADQPVAGQPVYESIPEVLADHRTGQGLPGTGRQLCG